MQTSSVILHEAKSHSFSDCTLHEISKQLIFTPTGLLYLPPWYEKGDGGQGVICEKQRDGQRCRNMRWENDQRKRRSGASGHRRLEDGMSRKGRGGTEERRGGEEAKQRDCLPELLLAKFLSAYCRSWGPPFPAATRMIYNKKKKIFLSESERALPTKVKNRSCKWWESLVLHFN